MDHENPHLTTLLLATLLLAGSDTPQPGPARYKWVVGTVRTLTSQLTTTLYYGPWPCRQDVFLECQAKCGPPHPFRGCIWLADVKFDGVSNIPFMGEVMKGGRFAVSHCCCDYPKVNDTQTRRDEWDAYRGTYRREWAERFGSWGMENGENWPGHHIHDIGRGGVAADSKNLIPVPPAVHKVFTKVYPSCYSGLAPWNHYGLDLPYTD